MKIRSLNELVEYLHEDKSIDVKEYIVNQVAKTTDNNKGSFWEEVLEKAMYSHTKRLHNNAVGRDFEDNSDAKIATFYRKTNGKLEASVSGIRNKIGTLRVCLCVPGQSYHRLMFMKIPHEAYQKYTSGSDAIKLTLSSTGNVQGKLSQYLCDFATVTSPVN